MCEGESPGRSPATHQNSSPCDVAPPSLRRNRSLRSSFPNPFFFNTLHFLYYTTLDFCSRRALHETSSEGLFARRAFGTLEATAVWPSPASDSQTLSSQQGPAYLARLHRFNCVCTLFPESPIHSQASTANKAALQLLTSRSLEPSSQDAIKLSAVGLSTAVTARGNCWFGGAAYA